MCNCLKICPLNISDFMVPSHLRFIRRELLRKLFVPCNHEKWEYNQLLNFSVHAIVEPIAGMNATA